MTSNLMRRDAHINVSIDELQTAKAALEFSASELSKSNVVKLRREAATIRRLAKEAKKVIEHIYERRPE